MDNNKKRIKRIEIEKEIISKPAEEQEFKNQYEEELPFDENIDEQIENENQTSDETQDNEKEEDQSDNENEDNPEDLEEEVDDDDEDDDESDDEADDEADNDDESDNDDKNKSENIDENEDGPDKENKDDRRKLHPDRKEEGQKDNKPKDKKGGTPDAGEAVKNKLTKDTKIGEVKKAVENVRRTAKVAGNVALTLLKFLLNPIFWIIVGIIIIIIYFSSTLAIIGQNDYNIMCDESGIGVVLIDPSADDFTRQSAIVSWLTSTPFEINGGRPLSREQAIGIMGNMMSESYGANPRAIQGDSSLSQWETTNNDEVLSWGNVGGKAVGIIQWDRGRRVELVNFAKSEGTQWYDLTTQLKFLKSEIDSGYENEQLISGGFNEPGKSLEEYTKIWNKFFERSAQAGTPAGDNPRIENAKAFSSAYQGGSFTTGLSSNCLGGLFAGGGVDTSNIVELAISSAWPNRSSALGSCSTLTNCGQTFATDAYKQAKIMAEAATSNDPIRGLLASCDRFVATMYRATGHDSSFPWGDTAVQGNYMRESQKWAQVSCQERRPGDVLWREGHVMLYVGNVNGKDSIASASIRQRTASLSGVSCQGDEFVADGDTAIGFRKVR